MTDQATKPMRAFLFGLREDGSPTCHPMVAIEDAGAIQFNTYRKSAKARNFVRDPRAAVLLLPDWQAPPTAGRSVSGTLHPMAPDHRPIEAGGIVPGSVRDRVRQRVDDGRRIRFRLIEA